MRTMRIYKEYFDLIKKGVKTLEIRVAYSSMKSIQVGSSIKFNDDPDCVRRVVGVREYASFEEMLSKEDPQKINPLQSAELQLIALRKIFPREKEQLGVLVFELT